ncbi:NnrS family protein [Aquipseudomonas alcaligenes]|uniref:NnrS family protein n=1 Tax=Aquipseudomonas alcaligenes TaxID=43263 RepID=A0AA42MZZ9_AQUAC|nr:NnrS family protein [Pseudomonas alcaligenes]MDH0141237.1 NnrS family protein [Pseudomonas alcaligenes]MDH1054590.1 NnrS family protein [Pseudomonas alcaligenes]
MLIIDKRKAMAVAPILRLGFRPFFLLGAVLAALAIPLWIAALQGWALPAPVGGWLAWHRHELVFGFAGAIIAGFLLTAVQTWTGRPSLSGRPLALLVGLWLLGRLSWWLPSAWPLLLFNLAFLLAVAGVMARLLWAVRQRRNYPIVLVLALLAAVDLLNLLGVLLQHDAWQRQGSHAAIWLVAAMMTLIGGRVIPFFTQRGLGRLEMVQPWAWLDLALLVGTLLLALLTGAGLLLQPHWGGAVLLLALGLGHGIRLQRWFDRGLLRVPLLWSLHLAYAWMVLACLGLGLWHAGVAVPFSQALHALTVGAMAGLILAMLARVSLGHTGRPLELPRGFAVAFVLLNLAALLRVLGVSFAYQPALWLAALAWGLAFAQFLYCYGPMLCRTRADGHPG